MPAPNLQTGFYTSLESKTRSGLSLARNEAFAAITRSSLPACAFAFTPNSVSGAVNPKLLRSVRFRGRDRGEILALDLFPAPSFGASVILPGLHSPWGFCIPCGCETLRIKAFSRLPHRKPAAQFNRLFFAPHRAFLNQPDLATWQSRSALRILAGNSFRPAWLSFRQPWN